MAAGLDTPRLFNTLVTLLKLRPGPKREPDLSYSVQPTVDIVEILRDYKVANATADISAAAGTYVPFHTVPAKKRWTILFLATDATTAASRVRGTVGGTTSVVSASTTNAERLIMERMKLGPGDSIGRDTTGNGADTARDMYLWYIEEDFVP